jgi:hypothetical protein
MSKPTPFLTPDTRTGPVYFLLVVLGFLLFSLAVFYMYGVDPQDTTDEARAKQRAKILEEIHTRDRAELAEAAWIDQAKGIVRLPHDVAVDLTVRELSQKTARATSVPAQSAPSLIKPPVLEEAAP